MFFSVWQYFKYFFKAQGITFLHSPFLYRVYNDIIQNHKKFYAFEEVERMRNELLGDKSEIQVTDLGAGSHRLKNNLRKIAQIAQYSALQAKEGRILFRIMEHFKPNYVIELGTSLGLGTLYLHKGFPSAKLHTIEGCPNISNFAQNIIKKELSTTSKKLSNIGNITFHIGNIDDILPTLCKDLPQIDLAYIDANHRFEPTIRYFEQILPKITEKSILIFDDIHWSKEMNDAWGIIQKNPKITLTIDLYSMGIVFFDKNLSKENFVLKI